mgnify:CR=1 FL=1
MKNTIVKDTLREIKKSFSRFISILAIIAIGVGFFAGIKASGKDMKLTADTYYDEKQLMDIRILSTMGFDEKDIDAIEKTADDIDVYPSHFLDVYAEKGYVQDTVRVHTLSKSTKINSVQIVQGRMPEKSGECVVESAFLRENLYNIGDTIKLTNEDENLSDNLVKDEYTIVGTIYSPQYISYERGHSSIGNGSIDYYLMIPEEDVLLDVYTEVYLFSESAQNQSSYSSAYEDKVDQLVKSLEKTAGVREEGRYNEILSEAQSKLDDAKGELQDGRKELEDGIKKANKKFGDAQKKIDDGLETLKNQENSFWSQINSAQKKIDAGLEELSLGQKAYEEGLIQYNQSVKEIEANIKSLNENKDNLPLEEYEAALGQYQGALALLQAKGEELSLSKEQIDASKVSLNQGQKELNVQKTKGISEINKGKAELAKAQETLKNEKNKFTKEVDKANKELGDGQKEIDDAQKEISDIEKPIWYVNTRADNPSYTEFGQNADRIDAIAKVFPVFFLLVAALVSLTTMTRMVEEQRMQIGTLKALGYSKISIVSKYFFYANLASLVGSILGLTVGFRLFPWVIFTAYGIMYDLPSVITPFHMDFALYSILAALICTSLSVYLACYKELLSPPSALMRPKAPKTGKRVLLEQIPILWNRMSFTTKVTVRNLFRYKKRMLMTVIGIAGSTSLILIGFGVKDSISDISKMQFGEISHYQMMTVLKDDADMNEIHRVFQSQKNITNYLPVYTNSTKASNQGTDYPITIFVPNDENKLNEFIHLRTYENHKPIKLDQDGVVITKKLSLLLDLDIGDEIQVEDSDNKPLRFEITGIAENYISHYVYMTRDYYEQSFDKNITNNVILSNLKDDSENYRDHFSEKLMKSDDIVGVHFTLDNVEIFDDMIVSLNIVVLVLILSASLLAFVVLYNLTNINVNERIREIATLKVLGFYDNEVSAYIYRENIALTFIGILVGSGLGTLLHEFVMQTAETNDLMFGRNITVQSYILSAILTLLFSIIINIAVHFKLKKVHMVESLKSVE